MERADPSPLLLLVEDDPDDLELGRIALARSRIAHRLAVARDGQEALEYLFGEGGASRDLRAFPDVMLLDLKLPRMDGKEVLRRIRQRDQLQRVPIVVLSSSDEPRDLADCYELRANSFFRKPVDFGEFTEGVSVLLYYWLTLNVPSDSTAPRPGAPPGAPLHRVPAARVAPLAPEGEKLDHVGPKAPVIVIDPDAAARERTVRGLADFVQNEPIGAAASLRDATRFLLAEGVCGGPDPWRCPYLVVIDVGADPAAGLDTLRTLRTNVDHRFVVVVFTANDDPAFRAECYRLHTNSFVLKPTDADDYRNVVRMMGFYWLKLNRSPPAQVMGPPVTAGTLG